MNERKLMMKDPIRIIRRICRDICIISGMICLLLIAYGAFLTYHDAKHNTITEDNENGNI